MDPTESLTYSAAASMLVLALAGAMPRMAS